MTRAKSPVHKVPCRRRREGRTDFGKRLRFVRSGEPRFVVRRSNKYIQAQLIKFVPGGDHTVLTVNAKSLEKQYKWPAKRNVWTAYLTGMLAGKKAIQHKIKKVTPDIGRYTPSKGAVVFAVLSGAVATGLEMGLGEDKVPADKLANPPENLRKEFEGLKKKILAG